MTTHTLFYCPGHLSFAPHVILRELGEPFELALVSIKDGATQSAEFRQLNPKGKVPVLHTGDDVLTESSRSCFISRCAFRRRGSCPIPRWASHVPSSG